MPKSFKGKIALDIRDSTPDWEPYLAPQAQEGAPNVLVLAWDDVGYGTMDVFGGPVETPNMRRIADRGVKFANFHTTALCSPTRASLLTGRNATTNGMATIAEFSSGFPGISTRIPFENGFMSEVLAEHGYNTYCLGKWHLTPGEECNLAAFKGRWPLGRGFERFYGWLGGETNNWYPGPRPRQPPDRPAGSARGRLSRRRRPLRPRRSSSSATRRSSTPTSRSSCTSRRRPVTRPTRCRWSGPTSTRASSTRVTRRYGPASWRARSSWDCCPKVPSSRRSTRTASPERTSPDGKPWPTLDTVRPWDSLSADEQRLFARMAEIFAGYISYWDDQLRPRTRLPRDVGPARQHDHRRHLRQRRERRGRTQRRVQRVAVLQRPRQRSGGHARAHRRARHAEVVQPLQHRVGVGVRHAVPVLEALGRRRGWRRRHVPRVVAREDQGRPDTRVSSTSTRSMSFRRSTNCSGSNRPRCIKGYLQSPIEGESFAKTLTDATHPGRETQFYTMLGQRSIYHQGWLASTVHPPLVRLGQLREGRVGAVPPRDATARRPRTSRPTTPNGSSR